MRSSARHADLRRLPGPIHRQHHGHGVGNARACAARLVDDAGRLSRSARRSRAAPGELVMRDSATTAARCRAIWSRAQAWKTPAPSSRRPAARPMRRLHIPAIAHEAGIRFTLDDVGGGVRAHAADRQSAAGRRISCAGRARGRRRADDRQGADRQAATSTATTLTCRRRHAGASVRARARPRRRSDPLAGRSDLRRPAALSCSRAISRPTAR